MLDGCVQIGGKLLTTFRLGLTLTFWAIVLSEYSVGGVSPGLVSQISRLMRDLPVQVFILSVSTRFNQGKLLSLINYF